MQLDMHYYGTYAVARSAGIKAGTAREIALAAQYVDDSSEISAEIADGAYIHVDATAHHPSELQPNTNRYDQRKVWVPFHFLPGNQGNDLHERLVCKKDSAIAREMVDNALTHSNEIYGSLLMGITAHVYADTFSHYGFSGISSPMNYVEAETIKPIVKTEEILQYVTGKLNSFIEQRAADAANLLGLGHGGVATCPDRPYLTWSFTYSDGRSSGERRNHETFLEACEMLHGMFTRFVQRAPEHLDRNAQQPFNAISQTVSDILACEGKLDQRIAGWQKASLSGSLHGSGLKEMIPEYDSATFTNEESRMLEMELPAAQNTTIYRFIQAANVHRRYVLQQLLPKHGLQVLVP